MSDQHLLCPHCRREFARPAPAGEGPEASCPWCGQEGPPLPAPRGRRKGPALAWLGAGLAVAGALAGLGIAVYGLTRPDPPKAHPHEALVLDLIKKAGQAKRDPVPEPPPEEPAPGLRLAPVVFLEPAGPDLPDGVTRPILLRELYRQALLLAARDGLGLATRDATLGEPPPEGLPADNRLHFAPAFLGNRSARLLLTRARQGEQRLVWKGEAPRTDTKQEAYALGIELAEKLARTEFVAALRKAGFDGKANPADPEAPVSPAAEKWLGEMTFTSQYAALRDLHAAARARGESPALLGGLVRGYAHLGLLTGCHWSSSPKVFHARSLLYAQRLVSADPRSPWGYWHRAYAAALAGLHALALDDLRKAGELREGQPAPPWVGLVEASCRFDTARLKELAGEGGQGQLADLLHYLSVEHASSVDLTLRTGQELLEDNPECYRVHDALAEMGGVGSLHATTLAGLMTFSRHVPGRLRALPGLPPEAARRLEGEAPEAEVWAALKRAGQQADDRAEPSWAVLARLGEDARFLQVCQRLYFMGFQWSVPVDDFLEQAWPLVAGHPAARFLGVFHADPQRDPEGFAKVLADAPFPDVDHRYRLFLNLCEGARGDRVSARRNRAHSQTDRCYHDLLVQLRFNEAIHPDLPGQYAVFMFQISPHAPAARAHLLSHRDYPGRAADWEKECQHPVLWKALGERYAGQKQFADAERCFRRSLALSADHDTYRALAGVYRDQGETRKWVRTLEAFLEEEDHGLYHARVRVDLANHYMSRGDFERARPYADAAAETWAAWAMLCASRCHEGLGDWEEAELWLRRVSDRYPGSAWQWFFFCKRTGKGDVAAARQAFEAYLARVRGQPSPNDLALQAAYHLLTGTPGDVPQLLEQAHGRWKYEWYALLAILTYDRQGDRADRDRLLAAYPAKGAQAPLVGLFRDTLGRGEEARPDDQAIARTLDALPEEVRDDACYFIGQFLENRGHADAALPYYRKAVAHVPLTTGLMQVLASVRLRELGKPEDNKGREPDF